MTKKPTAKLLLFVASFFMLLVLTTGSVCFPQSAVSGTDRDEEYSLEDLKGKMEKAIAIMEIIKDDIEEIESETKGSEDTLSGGPAAKKTRPEEIKTNIDKMIKVMEVIRDDVDEIDALNDEENLEE